MVAVPSVISLKGPGAAGCTDTDPRMDLRAILSRTVADTDRWRERGRLIGIQKKKHTQVVFDGIRLLFVHRFVQRTVMETIITKPISISHILLLYMT